jgi:hypothetical protein
MATGLSIAAIVIALIALVTSRQALTWQKRQDIARVTPSVRIEFEHSADPQSVYVWSQAMLEDPRPTPLDYRLTINVVNAGQTTERLRRMRVEAVDHSAGVDVTADSYEELQPRARLTYPIVLETIPKWRSGFIAIASLAGGEEVVSDVEHADADLLAHIEEHNRDARP